jgi:hypothetical protein
MSELTIEQMWDALKEKFPDAVMRSSDWGAAHWVGRESLSEGFVEEDGILDTFDNTDEGTTAWNVEKKRLEAEAQHKAIRDAYAKHIAPQAQAQPSVCGNVHVDLDGHKHTCVLAEGHEGTHANTSLPIDSPEPVGVYWQTGVSWHKEEHRKAQAQPSEQEYPSLEVRQTYGSACCNALEGHHPNCPGHNVQAQGGDAQLDSCPVCQSILDFIDYPGGHYSTSICGHVMRTNMVSSQPSALGGSQNFYTWFETQYPRPKESPANSQDIQASLMSAWRSKQSIAQEAWNAALRTQSPEAEPRELQKIESILRGHSYTGSLSNQILQMEDDLVKAIRAAAPDLPPMPERWERSEDGAGEFMKITASGDFVRWSDYQKLRELKAPDRSRLTESELIPYARHKTSCPLFHGQGCTCGHASTQHFSRGKRSCGHCRCDAFTVGPCTCGLAELLASAAIARGEERG